MYSNLMTFKLFFNNTGRKWPILFLFLLLYASYSNGQSTYILYNWNCISASVPTSAVSSYLTPGKWIAGNSNSTELTVASNSPSTGYSGASGTNNFGVVARGGLFAQGSNGSTYFEITFAPLSCASITLYKVSLGSRSTVTGPTSYKIRHSADSYASDLAAGLLPANSTWTLLSNAIQPTIINSGKETTIRIFGFGGKSLSSDSVNWKIDDISLSFVVTSPTIPTITSTTPTCLEAGTSTISNYNSSLTYTFSPSGPTVGAGGIITGMLTGSNYTVKPGVGICTSSISASFSNRAKLVTPATPLIKSVAATCLAAGTSTILNYNSTFSYSFSPSGPLAGASGMITGASLGTNYVVTADNGSCPSQTSVSFSNEAPLTPAVPNIKSVTASCVAAGSSGISNYNSTLTYTFSPSGPVAGTGGAITGMTPGTPYTVTAGNGSCTSGSSVSFSNGEQLNTPVTPNITSVMPTCVKAGSSSIGNYNSTLIYTFSPSGPVAGAGGAITGMTPGTHYTVTAGNGSCTSGASASFNNGAQIPPSITVTSVTGSFRTEHGTPSSPQFFTVTGSCLTENITVIAPLGFEISSDGGTVWASTATFIKNGDAVNGNLGIRLERKAPAGSYDNKNIVLSSAGAAPVNITTSSSGNVVNKQHVAAVPICTFPLQFVANGQPQGPVFYSSINQVGLPYTGKLIISYQGRTSIGSVFGPSSSAPTEPGIYSASGYWSADANYEGSLQGSCSFEIKNP